MVLQRSGRTKEYRAPPGGHSKCSVMLGHPHDLSETHPSNSLYPSAPPLPKGIIAAGASSGGGYGPQADQKYHRTQRGCIKYLVSQFLRLESSGNRRRGASDPNYLREKRMIQGLAEKVSVYSSDRFHARSTSSHEREYALLKAFPVSAPPASSSSMPFIRYRPCSSTRKLTADRLNR